MDTDGGWRRVYAVGCLVSVGITLVAARMWQLHLREVEQRDDEAERTRDEAARRKAVEERLRIARELHDSLTHSISVIKVQAGGAGPLAPQRGPGGSAGPAGVPGAPPRPHPPPAATPHPPPPPAPP